MLSSVAHRMKGLVSTVPGGSTLISGLGRSVERYGAIQLLLAHVAYVVGIAAYKLGGLRFGVGFPETVSQFMDSSMLQHDYFRTIWYLHAQPPLFNAWMGAVQKWSPLSDALSYHLTFLVLGWVLMCSLIVIARALDLGRTAAAVLGVVIALAPPVVMFQHWFFYDFPMAVLVTATIALVSVWARVRRARWAFAAMLVASAAVLTRSMMHPLWLVGLAAVIVIAWRPARRELRPAALALAIPILLVAGVMVKNQVLFGTPQLSSWYGLNLYRTVVMSQPADVQKEWEATYGVDPFGVIDQCTSPYPGVPVLDQQYKAPEIPNWNWYCTIAHHKSLEALSYRIIRGEPSAVLHSVAGSAEMWFSSTDFWVGVRERREEIEPVSRVWRNVIGWDRTWDPPVSVPSVYVGWGPDRRFHLSIFAVLTALIVYGGGIAALRRLVRRRGRAATEPTASDTTASQTAAPDTFATPSVRTVTTVATAWTVGFSFLVGTVFEHGENARFRFVTEPLTLCAAVALAAGAVAPRLISWWGARNESPATVVAES